MPDPVIPLVKPYTSLERVQRETGNSTAKDANRLVDSINLASRMVDRMCLRDFWFHDHSGSHEPYEVDPRAVIEDLLALPFEVRTLTAITVGETSLGPQDYSFRVGRRNVSRRTGTDLSPAPVWCLTPQLPEKITLVGTFGFPLDETATDPQAVPPPTLPAEIVRATTLIAATISGLYRKERVGLDGNRVDILETRIPVEARDMLRPFMYQVGIQF